MFADSIPVALIGFMESYSVANRLAIRRKEVVFLSTGQELWSIGLCNILCTISSGYPVSGSYSRSALSDASGSKTPLAKCFTLLIICLTLKFFTREMFFIPYAALSSIIFVAMVNIISFSDMWEAWKFSKKDCFVMVLTFCFTLCFTTSVGLAIGIAASIFVVLYETAVDDTGAPVLATLSELLDKKEEVSASDVSLEDAGPIDYTACSNTTKYVRLNADFSFLVVPRLQECLTSIYVANDIYAKNDDIYKTKIVILDFIDVRHIDLTALLFLKEISHSYKAGNIKFYALHCRESIKLSIQKMEEIKIDIIDNTESNGNSILGQPRYNNYVHNDVIRIVGRYESVRVHTPIPPTSATITTATSTSNQHNNGYDQIPSGESQIELKAIATTINV